MCKKGELFLEKFALLNLLKAIDGLQREKTAENAPSAPSNQPPVPEQQTKKEDMPNFMYETLLRHETISNRLKNRKQ